MEFRTRWLSHAGSISRHREVAIHAFDREVPRNPINLLDVGVENGGSLEVWAEILPEGSTVTGLDVDSRCASLGLPVIVCDVTNRDDIKKALHGKRFDVIIDSTRTMTSLLWPYLRAGGVYIYEGYDLTCVAEILSALDADVDAWLPIEEILSLNVYQGVVALHKRNPKVIPYMEVMTGNFCDVIDERDLIAQGVRRVLVD